MTEETKQLKESPESKAVEITDSIVGQCMIGYDICPLKKPIKYRGESYDCMVREREGVIRDRVHAVGWSKDIFNEEYTDAVRAYFIAEICRFGKLELETIIEKTKEGDFIKVIDAQLTNKTQIPVDTVVDALSMKDYASVSYMLGKH